MTKKEYFSTSLRYYRKQKNWSQETLAEILEVSTRTVQILESGDRLPSLTLLIRIADVFDTSIDDLLCLENRTKNNLCNIISNMSKDEKQLVIQLAAAISEMCK